MHEYNDRNPIEGDTNYVFAMFEILQFLTDSYELYHYFLVKSYINNFLCNAVHGEYPIKRHKRCIFNVYQIL